MKKSNPKGDELIMNAGDFDRIMRKALSAGKPADEESAKRSSDKTAPNKRSAKR